MGFASITDNLKHIHNMHRKLLIVILLFLAQISLHGQVTIGSAKNPEVFSSLEIISTIGGLRYPQLSATQKNALGDLTGNNLAYGLVLFNTNNDGCLEYLAETTGWINLCNELLIPKTKSHSTPPTISEENEDDISQTLSKSYILSFESVVGVSNLRTGKYYDANNIIAAVEGNIEGDAKSKDITITVRLNQNALNINTHMPEASIYVIYKENGSDRRIEFRIQINNGKIKIIS